MDCVCEAEAGVAVLVDNENPVKEPVVPEEVDELLVPKPVKELVVVATVEVAGADVEAWVAAWEELTPKAGTAGVEAEAEDAAVLAAAGVAAEVVVTVENKGAVEVPKESEVGFAIDAGVVEGVAAEEALLKVNESWEPDDEEAGVPNKKPEELAADEEEANEGIVVEAVEGVGFENRELLEKENPVVTVLVVGVLDDEVESNKLGNEDAALDEAPVVVDPPNNDGVELDGAGVDEKEFEVDKKGDTFVALADNDPPNKDADAAAADDWVAPNRDAVGVGVQLVEADDAAPNWGTDGVDPNRGEDDVADWVVPNRDVGLTADWFPPNGDVDVVDAWVAPKSEPVELGPEDGVPKRDEAGVEGAAAAVEPNFKGDGVDPDPNPKEGTVAAAVAAAALVDGVKLKRGAEVELGLVEREKGDGDEEAPKGDAAEVDVVLLEDPNGNEKPDIFVSSEIFRVPSSHSFGVL